VDVRRPFSPISGGIALAALSATCSGGLHPIRAGNGADAGADANVVCPDSPPVGFATMSDVGGEWDGGATGMPSLQITGGVTGGGAATQVVVDASNADALATFSMYASEKMPGPLNILVKGMIGIPPPPDGGSGDVQKIRVSSNKTVAGLGGGSGFWGGGLALTGVSNVILRNLLIQGPNADDSSDNVDAIHIETSHQIWVDHCDLSSNGPTGTPTYDGLIDISDGSDFVTVSWTHYHDHGDTGLVGRSDSSAAAAEDAGKNHVTYDHDRFSNVLTGPRLRFGTIHVLNSLFQDVANYGVASIDGAGTRIENSVFRNVAPPPEDDANFGWVTTILTSATAGSVDLVGNLTDALTGAAVPPTPPTAAISLQYAYSADSADAVQSLVTKCAGTGVVGPLPPTN
jgi:pectate lyase